MRTRVAVVALVTLNLASLAVSVGLSGKASDGGLAGTLLADDSLIGVSWTLAGAVLAWLRPTNTLGWLFLAVGTSATLPYALGGYASHDFLADGSVSTAAQWSAWLASGLWLPAFLLVNVVLALYPTGHLPGTRWRWPVRLSVVGVALLTMAALLDPAMYRDIVPGTSPLSAQQLAFALYLLAAATAIPATLAIWVMSVIRLARSRGEERQQLAWLLTVVIVVCVLALVPGQPEAVFDLSLFLVPVAVGVGVFRHSLLGIEIVLRRGLVYAVLTGAVLAVYVAATALAGSQLTRQPLPGVLAAVLVAVALTPLRSRVQGVVDRLLYGARRDPLGAVTQMGAVVGADHGDLLGAVLAGVTDAVRSPGAVVRAPDGREIARHGVPGGGLVIPLRFGGADVGSLEVAARTPGESYTSADTRVLAALSPQVAIVSAALDLSEALEKERDNVLVATRTERERLRRDLHDGLGPSLSGVRLGLAALQDAVADGDAARAKALLDRIRTESDLAVGEIRRIIDGLRPAVLDANGLANALRHHAEAGQVGLTVDVDIPDLPPLPPAVEAAAYRIAQEALTNVSRHAAADCARLTVGVAHDALTLEVADDGTGIAREASRGVGIASMRQRAESLGGILEVTSSHRGTVLVAVLPMRTARP